MKVHVFELPVKVFCATIFSLLLNTYRFKLIHVYIKYIIYFESCRFSELRFKLPVKMEGRREIPPTLEALTVSVHVGDDEEIIGMSTIEVEDIEGCVSWYQVELHFVTLQLFFILQEEKLQWNLIFYILNMANWLKLKSVYH